MNTLSMAKIWLLQKQKALYEHRKLWGAQETGYEHPSWYNTEFFLKVDVVAAMCWVWDLQNDPRTNR